MERIATKEGQDTSSKEGRLAALSNAEAFNIDGAERRIHVFNSMPFFGRGQSETCYRICGPWAEAGYKTEIYTSLVHRDDPFSVLSPVIPRSVPKRLKFNIAKFLGADRLRTRSETQGLRKIRPGDICYFWPDASIEAMRKARDLGGIVVTEYINTHVGFAEKILEAEGAHFNLPENPDKARLLQGEEGRLQAAHLAFAPGPFVGQSIRSFTDADIEILESSYGTYLPQKNIEKKTSSARTRFLFVGLFCLRKGARILLDAWEKADLNAELKIVGILDPLFEKRVTALAKKNVHFLGYRNDIEQIYRDADVFVFPSLEEGGPQVTYEAAAYGMPLIVTPMGGGRIANEGNAIFVGASDAEHLAHALVKLDSDAALRCRLGKAAQDDARYYEWGAVSQRRLVQLLDAAQVLHPLPEIR